MGAGGLESLNEVKRTICTRLLNPICFAFGALGVPCGADSLPFVLAAAEAAPPPRRDGRRVILSEEQGEKKQRTLQARLSSQNSTQGKGGEADKAAERGKAVWEKQ